MSAYRIGAPPPVAVLAVERDPFAPCRSCGGPIAWPDGTGLCVHCDPLARLALRAPDPSPHSSRVAWRELLRIVGLFALGFSYALLGGRARR